MPGGQRKINFTALDEHELVQALDLIAAHKRPKGEVEIVELRYRGQTLKGIAACHRRPLRN